MTEIIYPYLHLQTLNLAKQSRIFSDYQAADEERLFFFGPIAPINIFVGATNSGKSRFLREIAKRNQFVFLPSEEILRTVEILRSSCRNLSKTSTSLNFQIRYNYSHAFDHWGPHWLREVIKKIPVGSEFDFTYEADFFQNIQQPLEQFVERRLDPARADGIASIDALEMGVQLTHAMVAGDIIKGNIKAENGLNNDIYGEPALLSNYGRSSIFSFDYKNRTPEFDSEFMSFWNAVKILQELPRQNFVTPIERIYIPTLRSIVSLRDGNGNKYEPDIFASTIQQNYGIPKYDEKSKSGLKVFTGLTLYDTLQRDKHAPTNIRRRLRDFENFLGNTFFEGRAVEIVPMNEFYSSGKHINLHVEGQFERDLHDVGDGIGSLIILMYQLFLAEPKSWIFIEEPELNLHPSLQRIFLQTILEHPVLKSKELRIFFTTHSNHLLRLTMPSYDDVSVFAFQKHTEQEKFLVRPVHNQQHHALSLLGVWNSSVLLANCSIWVEGVTDRQYIRAYLKAYMESEEFKRKSQRPLREDMHYAFWEYAGSNLAHYLFDEAPQQAGITTFEEIHAKFLSNRIFLIADRDESKAKTEKHRKLQALERATFAYAVTPGVEVENLISAQLLNLCLPHLFPISQEELGMVRIDEKDYKNERMGSYLKRILPTQCPASLVAKSLTLETYYKNKLASLVAEKAAWENMSGDAKKLTRRLYDFLLIHNT